MAGQKWMKSENPLPNTRWTFKNITVLLKNSLPLFYFLLQSQVCQYLEDRPLLRRYYRVWPVFYKKVKCYLNIDSFSHASQNFINFSCMEKYSKHKFKRHVVLNHPHIQHLQDLELCQMRKQNKDFKEMVVLLCLVKSFKNSAFDEHKALFKIPRWNTKGI